MKRPVTSLCCRPGKKDRLRGSLSPVWEQFPPIETLCGGQADLPGKSRPNEGLKTVPGEAGGCVQAAPMWEWRTSCAGWCLEGAALGARRGREHVRAQKQSPAGGLGTAPMGERRVMEVSGAGKAPHWAPGGTGGHARAQKQSPARAGDCLDAGYGCYLPRAIRVIWMHRVGSTARPRIMPS